VKVTIKSITDGQRINVDVEHATDEKIVLVRDGERHKLPKKFNPINTNLLIGDRLEAIT
jgi:hypothetical protein